MQKPQPVPLVIARDGDFTIQPRFTAATGTDMSAWTSKMVAKDNDENELFTKTSALTIVTPGVLNIAEATFSLTEQETKQFDLGKIGSYHILLIDAATDWQGVVLHGSLETYVDSGGT